MTSRAMTNDLVKRLREADSYSNPNFVAPFVEPIKAEAANYIEELDRDWIDLNKVAVANVKELLAAQTKIAKLERAVSALRYLHAHADLKKQARKSIQVALAELEMEE